jgi:hypothetical protein
MESQHSKWNHEQSHVMGLHAQQYRSKCKPKLLGLVFYATGPSRSISRINHIAYQFWSSIKFKKTPDWILVLSWQLWDTARFRSKKILAYKVGYIDFSFNKLFETIPPHVNLPSQLVYLDLSSTSLSDLKNLTYGTIPKEMGNIKFLLAQWFNSNNTRQSDQPYQSLSQWKQTFCHYS